MVYLQKSTSINFERGVRNIFFAITLKFVFSLKRLRVEQLQNIQIKWTDANSKALPHPSSKSNLFREYNR